MPTVTVSDDQGQLMVTVDGGEPQPVQTAEEACSIIEQTFGQPDGDEQMRQEVAGEVWPQKQGGAMPLKQGPI